jgi:protein-tyrosine phosphatase
MGYEIRTSISHPLRVDSVSVGENGGLIGMTLCPGKQQMGALTGNWARDLSLDIDALKQWQASLVVSLIEDAEFDELGVATMPELLLQAGIEWLHMPIPDYHAPDSEFDLRWHIEGPKIQQILESGGHVVLHCKGGLGRAGTIAAKLLIERGYSSEQAIRAVRAARSSEAIQTLEQENYLQQLAQ